MFCKNCGNPLQDENVFCTACGQKVAGNETAREKNNNNPTKIKKVAICAVGALLVVAVVFVLVMGLGGAHKLEYDWETTLSEVENNEVIIWEDEWLGGEYRMCCEDPYHEIDGIEEFVIEDDEVLYWFDKNGKLYEISYYMVDGDSVTERLDVLKGYYGDEYYYSERMRTYYWWIDDTVIEFSVTYNQMTYRDERKILDRNLVGDGYIIFDSYADVKEYFGKDGE